MGMFPDWVLTCHRAQKSVETALADLNMTNTPDMPTRETCGAWLALRKEIIELQDLKRKVQGRADGAGSVGPEGRGKRSHKGKVGISVNSDYCLTSNA